MATQYTAGLTTGQVLTAATMNSIGAAWETWTPTITASVGTFTTTTVNTAQFGRINKIVFGKLDVSIVTVGTAAGALQFTLPITADLMVGNGDAVGVVREVNLSGNFMYYYLQSSTVGRITRYDAAFGLASGARVAGYFAYEAS
jgi:hypothetical protein